MNLLRIDMETDEGKKLGEFEHGMDIALNGKKEDEDMGRKKLMLHIEY